MVYDTPNAVRVLNFNSTVHWRQPQSCSLEPTQFRVFYRSEDQKWTRSRCSIGKDATRNLFSCEFLTCAVAKEQVYYVQVRVRGSSGRSENIILFHPSLESMSLSMKDVRTLEEEEGGGSYPSYQMPIQNDLNLPSGFLYILLFHCNYITKQIPNGLPYGDLCSLNFTQIGKHTCSHANLI